MSLEMCFECDDATGNAGELDGSLMLDGNPYCDECYQDVLIQMCDFRSAEIKRLTTENEAMAEQLNRATEYASRLATTIYKRHYSDVKGWELCDSLQGVISQIDNMTAGIEIKRLTAERDAMREQLREARDNGSDDTKRG